MPLAAVMTAPHKPIEIQDLPTARMEPAQVKCKTAAAAVTVAHSWVGSGTIPAP